MAPGDSPQYYAREMPLRPYSRARDQRYISEMYRENAAWFIFKSQGHIK
jgi:hypothetical protein